MSLLIILIASLIALIAEGLIDAKHGDKHDLISNLKLGATIVGVGLIGKLVGVEFVYTIAFYSMLRVALFDYIFSYAKYGHIWFIGTTSHWDKKLTKIANRTYLGVEGAYMLLAARVVILISSVFYVSTRFIITHISL